ncbi:metal-dependent hydrolase [Vulcanibacillus modesticaldus]|uniref:UPF0173 metal-dependent hydrolase BHF71_06370 n=1 Tax=Vulcanibacillus modesticaldus TaxID=337097 RepID=A0A1D2YWS1_9BACI|nr:metal-dependent hydrolase [Vulcanibacillus modesticaldus]OEG00067.1 metal-dependent hydrolase [Vulcanibacillus modesticaldus]
MEVRYHGHSCVEFRGDLVSIIIDPFIKDNPLASVSVDEIKVNYIYITHGHGDHLGDAIQIAKNNDATIIAPYELATFLSWQGVKVHPLHIGGSFQFDFGRVKATPAFHGSSFVDEERKEIVYLGMPSGVIIELGDKKIYHAGDTGLFNDMRLLEREQLDLAFLPIGDNFTMGPDDALLAAVWIRAKKVVPIHYDTFPYIKQNPTNYVERLNKLGIEGEILPFNKWVRL